MESEKFRSIEATSELRRSEVSYQMKIQKLESSLKYSSLELEKISSENQDLENRIESKNDEIKKLANQVRDLRGEHSSLQDKCTTSEQEN